MPQDKDYARNYYLKNKSKILKRVAQYSKANRAKCNAAVKRWKNKNKQKVKDTDLKINFGISLKEYEDLLVKQQGCCAICKVHKDKLPRALSVDHCHLSGKIRGLLCVKCNTAIGMLNDDKSLVKSALEYLQ